MSAPILAVYCRHPDARDAYGMNSSSQERKRFWYAFGDKQRVLYLITGRPGRAWNPRIAMAFRVEELNLFAVFSDENRERPQDIALVFAF